MTLKSNWRSYTTCMTKGLYAVLHASMLNNGGLTSTTWYLAIDGGVVHGSQQTQSGLRVGGFAIHDLHSSLLLVLLLRCCCSFGYRPCSSRSTSSYRESRLKSESLAGAAAAAAEKRRLIELLQTILDRDREFLPVPNMNERDGGH